MGDYHTVYKGPEGATTEWEDLQVKHGNWEARPKPAPAPLFAPEIEAGDEQRDTAWLDGKDAEELSDMEDDMSDDRFLEQYRQKRIAELQAVASAPRYGSVEMIRGSEFVQKVSQAGTDIWVVVHLFKEGHAGCKLLAACLETLSAKYPGTKFVKIISTECIPNYPDANLPTLLLYHDAACVKHVVGLRPFGGVHMTSELVAAGLNAHGPVCGTTDEREMQQQIKELVHKMIKKREDEIADKGCDSD